MPKARTTLVQRNHLRLLTDEAIIRQLQLSSVWQNLKNLALFLKHFKHELFSWFYVPVLQSPTVACL